MATTISKINTLYPLKYQEGGSFNVGIGFTVNIDFFPQIGNKEIYLEIQNGNDFETINASSGLNSVNTALVAKKDAQQTQSIPIKVIVWFTPTIPPGMKQKLAEKTEFITVEKECVEGSFELLEQCPNGYNKHIKTCIGGNIVEETFTCGEEAEADKKKSPLPWLLGVGGFFFLLLLGKRRKKDEKGSQNLQL